MIFKCKKETLVPITAELETSIEIIQKSEKRARRMKWLDAIIANICTLIGGIFIGRFIESIACGHLKF
jgi:hypothetical protein